MAGRNWRAQQEQIRNNRQDCFDSAIHKDFTTVNFLTSDNWYHLLLRHQQLPTMISGFSKPNIGRALIDETFS